MSHYDFDERVVMSEGVQADADVEVILRSSPLQGVIGVRHATPNEDRHGTDWWVDRVNGRSLSVDVKARSPDYALRGHDDLALELWSAKATAWEGGRIGWTLDPRKQTDYILWLWQESGRWCLVPFPLLSAAFKVHYDEWCRYRHAEQTSHRAGRTWVSECVYVPRVIVWRAIYDLFGGAPARRGRVA